MDIVTGVKLFLNSMLWLYFRSSIYAFTLTLLKGISKAKDQYSLLLGFDR